MTLRSGLLAIAAIAACAGCNAGRHSRSAFRLPPDGDVDRGKAAFVALGCQNCHEVTGTDLPRPAVPVLLGGATDVRLSDAFLVTSIVNPGYGSSRHRESRMPHYADRMTVRQLTDVVAFLQSSYYVRRQPDIYH